MTEINHRLNTLLWTLSQARSDKYAVITTIQYPKDKLRLSLRNPIVKVRYAPESIYLAKYGKEGYIEVEITGFNLYEIDIHAAHEERTVLIDLQLS